MKGFVELGVAEVFDEVLRSMGVRYPLTAQSAVIGRVLKGQDVLLLSGTGTGKTLAYALPAIQVIDMKKAYPQVLVVTPTRELTVQVAEVLKKLASVRSVRVLTILGGKDFYEQQAKLEKAPHAIVGTPGRILDHAKRGTVSLTGIKFWVLDEVDEMLQRGFLDDIAQLFAFCSQKHQTFVCSATLPDDVVVLSKRIMQSPKLIDLSKDMLDTKSIKHVSVKISEDKKYGALLSILQQNNPYLAIIFCSSIESAVRTESYLSQSGVSTDVLHGDMSQTKRLQVMKRFRKAAIQVLVATDLAARGIDIEGITHVINFELPKDAQQYVHRVGRTGRAGQKGTAITLYIPGEEKKLKYIEEKLAFEFLKQNVAGEERSGRIKNRNLKKSLYDLRKK